ncbi:MAG: MFS transporter [Nocardioidaceae bacterium]
MTVISNHQQSRGQRRRVLVTLCVTEITSWGVLYYAFPVLSGDIIAATGWSTGVVTAAFSAGLLVAAGVGVLVGRWIDRDGPRLVMTCGSVLAVLALLAVAAAPSPAWFVAAWVAGGAAMAAVLYPPAFAALTRWHGADRVRALTVLTLAAGLASTVFAPLTASLAAHLDWRWTYVVLAVVVAVVTVPGHWWGLRGPWPKPDGPSPARVHDRPQEIARSRPFVLLAVALGITAFTAMAVIMHLVPLMAERGIDTRTAAVALGLGGVGQLAGRLAYGALARHTSVRARTATIVLGTAATTAVLGVVTSIAALVAAAVAAGVVRGIFTLLQATAVTDRWGSTHYGRLSGLLTAPATVAMALAPWGGAALARLLGGYPAAFLVLALASLTAVALALAGTPTTPAPRR